jgi:predicted tellurium resistance membrane protein TerC
MTPTRARQLARRWFLAFIAAFVVRHVLLAVGINLLDLPLSIAEVLAVAFAWRHYGWIDGYRAATAREVTP